MFDSANWWSLKAENLQRGWQGEFQSQAHRAGIGGMWDMGGLSYSMCPLTH